MPCGKVETGILKPGMHLHFEPVNITADCKSIEMHNSSKKEAHPGDNVGFNVKGVPVNEIKRGYVASDANNKPCAEAEWFKAQIIVLNHPGGIHKGYTPVIDCHTTHVPCRFEELETRQDKRTGEILERNPALIKNGEAALCKLVPMKPFVCETFHDFPPLGRFAVRDSKHTIAVGIIKEVKFKDKSLKPPGPPFARKQA